MAARAMRRCLMLTPAIRKGVSLAGQRQTLAWRLSTVPKISSASFHTSIPRLGESSNVINIQSEEDFKDRVLQNQLPVVLDFHASWCGPCKLLGPRLETLVGEKKDKVILAKVDIDQLPDIAVDHGVEAVPTVLAVKGGKVVDRFVGLKEDDILESFVEKLTG